MSDSPALVFPSRTLRLSLGVRTLAVPVPNWHPIPKRGIFHSAEIPSGFEIMIVFESGYWLLRSPTSEALTWHYHSTPRIGNIGPKILLALGIDPFNVPPFSMDDLQPEAQA